MFACRCFSETGPRWRFFLSLLDSSPPTPSPGTPGEGRGEGFSRQTRGDDSMSLREPSPQPSPGIPGEGAVGANELAGDGEEIEVIKDPSPPAVSGPEFAVPKLSLR